MKTTLEEALKRYNEANNNEASVLFYDDGSGRIIEDATDPYGIGLLFRLHSGGTEAAIQWLLDNSKPQWEKDAEELIDTLSRVDIYPEIKRSPLGEDLRRGIKEWFKNKHEQQTT